jgi:hypothetical protein
LGIKLFAANGKVEIQAQNDNLELTADKEIKIISANDKIHISSPKEILLTANGSYIKIDKSGVETGTSGIFTSHAKGHNLEAAKTMEPLKAPWESKPDEAPKETANEDSKNDEKTSTTDLTPEDIKKIESETNWPPEVIKSIRSMEEYKIYHDLKLQYMKVNGRDCLVLPKIDKTLQGDGDDNNKDTNIMKMKKGQAPYYTKDDQIHLHHMGQDPNGVLVHLPASIHLDPEKRKILHCNGNQGTHSEENKILTDAYRATHWHALSLIQDNTSEYITYKKETD